MIITIDTDKAKKIKLAEIHAKYNETIANVTKTSCPNQTAAVAKIRSQWQAEIKAVMGL